MGLFDKKFCDVCGEKIGLLGNRKLEDGNLCKNCARKLSPFFSERKNSTIAEIKQQLAYREENKRFVPTLQPTKTYGHGYMKVYVDMNQRKFIVTSDSDWRNENPDVIDFSQVTSVSTDIKEHRHEIYYKDSEGKNCSYSPRRYEYEYEFTAEIMVNSPWFSEIKMELSSYSRRPDSQYSPSYRDLEMMQGELVAVLTGQQLPTSYAQPQAPFGQQPMYNTPNNGYNQPVQGTYGAGYVQSAPANTQPAAQTNSVWVCPGCGTQNKGKFCESCGSPQPVVQKPQTVRCDKCGWMSQPGQPAPKFCPECGDPVDFRDMA